MGRVVAWARTRRLPAVTLTTFRHLPWNAPFYQRLGFRILSSHERTPGLAEVLQARGYETAGIVSHLYVGQKYNYQQGFGFWDESQAQGHTHVSSHEVTNKAIEFLRRSGERRFFLFLHYFDPHFDYIQHEKYDYSEGYSGPVRSGNDNCHELRKLAWSGQLKRPDIRYLHALYDSEISYTDEHIGRFLDELKRRGLYDDALIIVTSDHGESIVDRPDRWIGHTINVYGENVNVPLILKLPGRHEHRTIEEWVSLIDIPPTILSLTGPEKPRGMPYGPPRVQGGVFEEKEPVQGPALRQDLSVSIQD